MTYSEFLEPIIEKFTTGEYYREVFEAKQQYFEKAGVVYEDDVEFDQRMNIFLDWYIFDRELPGVDLPPIKYYYRKNKETLKEEDAERVKELCKTIHSIFRLKRKIFGKNGFVIQDLFSGETFKVVDENIQQGFNKGDIFEARLIPFDGKLNFSKGFCFHPIEMESFILSEIKKVKFQDQSRKTKLILQLSAMKLKQLRFQHIDVRHIYTFESRF